MTSKNIDPSYGLPPPVTELTMEQDLKMRVIRDRITEVYHDNKKEIIEVFMALQKQNFILSNSLTNLVKNWPYEEIFYIHSGQGIQKEIQS